VDRLYLFCTCIAAFCRFLPIEPIEFSKSFENSRSVTERPPPPPPDFARLSGELRLGKPCRFTHASELPFEVCLAVAPQGRRWTSLLLEELNLSLTGEQLTTS
jgi:hypothetical protein